MQIKEVVYLSNRLAGETSPYLLQHKDNPVDWYPWCQEAFERAKREDKPIFLSIGYSACHWCHVLAHESFEDEEIAALLNEYFISVKVDKEERPDIDSVYMAVCQAFTGGGGWPTSIFMTADGRPFFAGTYFPKTSRRGMIGMRELILSIHEAWVNNRSELLAQADEIIGHLNHSKEVAEATGDELIHTAVGQYERIYDKRHGGFGRAPKFPTPHNLLFLLGHYKRYGEASCLKMAEHTLIQMYRGGIFDHVGFGFCRYSTDKKFLAPHFEKMLYDNALLILASCKAYRITKKELYLEVAEKTAKYILDEMTCPEGGFYSSQDADSEGEEGKYYLFTPSEVIDLLGREEGERLCRHFDITEAGNFEGKSIPNLLRSDHTDGSFDKSFQKLYSYRRGRYSLHRDEKILTSWNALMISAMCELYLTSKKEIYLSAAMNADRFIQKNLYDKGELYVSYHMGRRGVKGFLDDYAAYIFALLALHRATLDGEYLRRAGELCDKVIIDFGDNTGGFYLYGKGQEELILRPKETYDGAIPSGNSLVAYNLVRLSQLTDEDKYRGAAERQIDFLSAEASSYPIGHAMLLLALLEHNKPEMKITVVADGECDCGRLALLLPPDAAVVFLPQPTKEYPLKDGKVTYYICRGHSCLPPTNEPPSVL